MKRPRTYAPLPHELDEALCCRNLRSTRIPCWIETHRRMKWRLAMKIASLPDERWTKKAAASNTRQTEQWDDQKRDGKMK